MSEAARIDLVDRAPLTEKQQNVYESIMQYQRVNGYEIGRASCRERVS